MFERWNKLVEEAKKWQEEKRADKLKEQARIKGKKKAKGVNRKM